LQEIRLKLVTNNSRFLILPGRHFPKLAARILSLCQNRLPADWQTLFGHIVVLLETFVDPQRFAVYILDFLLDKKLTLL